MGGPQLEKATGEAEQVPAEHPPRGAKEAAMTQAELEALAERVWQIALAGNVEAIKFLFAVDEGKITEAEATRQAKRLVNDEDEEHNLRTEKELN